MTRNQSQASVLDSIFEALSYFSDLEPSHQDKQQSPRPQGDSQLAHKNGVQRLPLSDQEKARPVFLTLHMLFPHELLPALDLLDRGLVTKFLVKHSAPEVDDQECVPQWGSSPGGTRSVLECSEAQLPAQRDVNGWEVFYVQSSSAMDKQISRPRFHPRGGNTSATVPFYEVRLDGWNCTCPAFSVSVFQSLNLQCDRDSGVFEDTTHLARISGSKSKIKDNWGFGGTATLEVATVPSCKHLVAAFLANAAPNLFTDTVKQSAVSREEAVAWGAGWSEHGGT
ncbi:hypothetical protein CLAIMM_13582 [Cladophialophora immunda]|nr:hypothetical protein CLAIMM_13582 [Cladophialophora immunda]